MSSWSIYIAPEEEKLLKGKIDSLAKKNRWSFSQAISEILREHLIEEKKRIPDEKAWEMMGTTSFFEGYCDQDSIYDAL